MYAHRREARLGSAAHALITDLAEGDRAWVVPWPCCHEFLSVVTNRRIWKDNASAPEQAWRQFQVWAASPLNHPIGETERFPTSCVSSCSPHVVGDVVYDVRIAHGIEYLLTHDGDFSLFPELPTRYPLRDKH